MASSSASNYFDESDSDSDEENNKSANLQKLSSEELTVLFEKVENFKKEGNSAFNLNDYEISISIYTQAINLLKQNKQPANPVIHLNRSAAYLAQKNYVKALHDANLACELDPANWKAHWRKGVALISMSKRVFRTKEAIKSFERCLECHETLPKDKIPMVEKELAIAKQTLVQQDAETGPPDLSKCILS